MSTSKVFYSFSQTFKYALFVVLLVFYTTNLIAQSDNHRPNLEADEFAEKSIHYGWKEGNRVSNLKINDINNKKLDLYSLLDKPLIVEFWSLNCKVCDANKKYLKSFFKQYNVNILGICSDDYPKEIRKKVNAQDVNWTTVYDDSHKFGGKSFAQENNIEGASFVLILPDKSINKIFYHSNDIRKLAVELQQYFGNN